MGHWISSFGQGSMWTHTSLLLLSVFSSVSQSSHSISQGLSSQDAEVVQSSAVNVTWTAWTHCNRNCRQSRRAVCPTDNDECKENRLKQRRVCWKPRGKCARETKAKRINARQTGGLEDLVYELLYDDWSHWSACTRSCIQRRFRSCALRYWCHDVVLIEERKCRIRGTKCDGPRQENGRPSQEESSRNEQVQPKRPAKKPDKKKNKKPAQSKLDDTVLNSLDAQCGRRNVSTRSMRIVGGHEAQKGAWPWQVAIMTRWKEQYCGGVLISPRHVLTAAHCLRRRGKRRHVIVRTGEYDIAEYEGTEEDFKAPKDYIHPKFDIETIDSDIAIIKLPHSVNMTSADIHYACVPRHGDVLPPNTLCHAVGWGKVGNTRVFGEDVLREARVPLVDQKKCQSAFEYEITENQMCAGYRRGGVDTCAGDSGGPLMCEIEKQGRKQWYVYGVTSFGEGCGDRGKYGIYTIVNNYGGWIRAILRK